jgi:hypothetical protein
MRSPAGLLHLVQKLPVAQPTSKLAPRLEPLDTRRWEFVAGPVTANGRVILHGADKVDIVRGRVTGLFCGTGLAQPTTLQAPTTRSTWQMVEAVEPVNRLAQQNRAIAGIASSTSGGNQAFMPAP